ncbi:hypothetical protein Cni_G16262 [Canna indica]|uniref:Dilute domain-containing protein n=1 Tax=Canna indica TaxID=4628 RepID=A0AAQ3KFS0_9LILI|nr:hypothetical protein Cni_G16262 [Canna indica]
MRENHEALIKCLKEYKSFDNKRPATTLIVYKSLFHWHSFEAERTNIFEWIIQTIRSSVENQENIGELAYWLSTTSTLLFLLQKNLRASNASSTGSYRSRATTSSFFSRIAQNARSSSSIMGISSGYSGMLGKPGSQSRIDAKYPALLFKQQLIAYVERLYAIIRDNLKKEISLSLTLCIQAPRFARSGTIGESPKSILSNNMAKQASNVHWQSIVKSLDSTLNILCENYKSELATHINKLQLIYSLLLRWEFCSFSNAEFVKDGLQDLEQWCSKTIEQTGNWNTRIMAGFASEVPKNLRGDQKRNLPSKADVLLSISKYAPESNKVNCIWFQVLSVPQIYRIGTMFWDDKYGGAKGLSQENVIEDGVTCHQNAIT